jgi:hypothetical protein
MNKFRSVVSITRQVAENLKQGQTFTGHMGPAVQNHLAAILRADGYRLVTATVGRNTAYRAVSR